MMKIILLIMFSINLNKKKHMIFLINMLMFLLMFFYIPLYNNLFNKIYYFWMMDLLSYTLIMLSLMIMNLSMLSNMNFLKNNFKNSFFYLMMILLISLIISFLSMNLFMFYLFFEISLIPMMLLIMGWGMQIDRIQASMYMLFYTLMGSLPFMLLMIYMYNKTNSLSLMYLSLNFFKLNKIMIWLLMNLIFLIKMPMYLIHMWLPKAHVEAPVSGSMILAGILLKLGTYGLYRMMLIMPYMYMKMNKYFMILNLLGSLYASMICMNNSDLKIIVAYSSIVHMSILFSGMITMNYWGMKGSQMLMISHGLCSSGLFFLVNLMYSRNFSRNIYINKGLINMYPSMTLMWFLMCSSNFSAPPSMNLFSEILIFNSLISNLKYLMILLMMIILMSSFYSMMLFSMTQHGKMNYFFNYKNMNCQEYLIIFMHWMILNLMFLKLNMY